MNSGTDLCSITRRARREFGLSQSELALCLRLPKESVIALESYRFVELDERQLEILAIYSGTLLGIMRTVYSTERVAYEKAQERKKKSAGSHPTAVGNNEADNVGTTGPNGSIDEIVSMVANLPEPMQAAVIGSFKAQLQCMVLGAAS